MLQAASEAVAYGEVFTKRWVVDAMLDLVGYTTDRDLTKLRLIEPSIGSGAFLLPVVERLVASAKVHGVPISELNECVLGMDLQPQHADTCQTLIVELLEREGLEAVEARALAERWVQVGDFLLADVKGEADLVVGNPPYIRSDDLDDDVEAEYRTRWKTMRGRADIYIGFYERSLGLLKSSGRLAFICADRWMRNAYGKRLRGLVVSGYAVESVWQMHDVDAFEAQVSAYPAITVLRNSRQGQATVIDTSAEFGAEQANQVLEFTQSTKDEASGLGWSGARLPSWFETEDFWPAGSPHVIKVLEELSEKFPTLEGDSSTRIGIGVATGADKAYIHPVSSNVDAEPARLLPIVTADDIRQGYLKPPAKVMLNPWDEQGQLVDADQFPRFAATLGSHESVKTRFVAKKNPAAWHRTIDKVMPGLAERPKLLLQDMKAQITPVLEPGGFYPHHNLYYIVSDRWDLEVLGGLLLSRVAEAFISAYGVKMRGGTLRFQAQYLRKIAVPAPDSINAELSERLRAAFRNNDRVAATEAAEEAYGLPAGTM